VQAKPLEEPRRKASLPSIQQLPLKPVRAEPVLSAEKPVSGAQTEVVLITETSSELYLLTTSLFASTFHGEVDPSVATVSEFVQSGKYQILALVDKSDRSVIGGAILGDIRGVHNDVVILEYFFVNPEKRGKGIGSKWFNTLLDYLKEHTTYKYMILECVESLIGFYTRLGAVDTGISPSLCVRSLSSSTTAATLSSSGRPATLLSLLAVSLRDDGAEFVQDQRLMNTIIAYVRKHLHRMITSLPQTFCSEQGEKPFNVWAQQY
jgi:GNAT superfamily N-acetyltransferase